MFKITQLRMKSQVHFIYTSNTRASWDSNLSRQAIIRLCPSVDVVHSGAFRAAGIEMGQSLKVLK